MKPTHSAALVAALTLVATPAVAAPKKPMQDHPSCTKDPVLFSRMPNYYMTGPGHCAEIQFDMKEFHVVPEGGTNRRPEKVRVEGHLWRYRYAFDKEAGAYPSSLQIIRNYQAAAARLGGETLWEDTRSEKTTLRIKRDGKEIWVEVSAGVPRDFNVHILEREEMKQDVLANAEALHASLNTTGHVEVKGLFFDTGKAELKPESEASLGEVAKLLKANAALKVWVVGHTDSVGSTESNLTLSNARAASVVKALVEKHGIAAARLASYGSGPYAPVASNASEDGRAKNRRVELVAQP